MHITIVQMVQSNFRLINFFQRALINTLSNFRLEDPQKFYGYNLQNEECELCLKLGDQKLRRGKKFANGRNSLKNPMFVKSLDDFVYKEESEECLV